MKDKITEITTREDMTKNPRDRHYFILAGHSKMDSGAMGCGYVEADLTMELRNLVIEQLRNYTSSVSNDDDFKTLRDVLNWLFHRTKEGDLILDIHFNASDNENATGVEAFIPNEHNPNEAKIADALSSGISDILGIKNRGVKTDKESSRQKLAIMSPLGNNVLLEVCFITNKSDMESYQRKKTEVAELIAKEIYG